MYCRASISVSGSFTQTLWVSAVATSMSTPLGVILGRQPRGSLLVRDELAGFLGDMNKYNKGGGDRAFWLEAYGGGPFSADRLSRGPVSIDGLSVGVVGGIQPDRLASLLIERDDDGFLARLCPVYPEPVPVRIPERATDSALAERAFSRLYGVEMPRDESGRATPGLIRFSPAASRAMEKHYEWVREHEDRFPGLLKSFLGKTPGMVARIALVLAMLDWAVGNEGAPPTEVSVEIFGRAHGFVVRYLLPMAQRAYAEASTSPEEYAARVLGRLLREERLPHHHEDTNSRPEARGASHRRCDWLCPPIACGRKHSDRKQGDHPRAAADRIRREFGDLEMSLLVRSRCFRNPFDPLTPFATFRTFHPFHPFPFVPPQEHEARWGLTENLPHLF